MKNRRQPEVRPLRTYPSPAYPPVSGLREALQQRPAGPWPFAVPPAVASLLAAATAAGCGATQQPAEAAVVPSPLPTAAPAPAPTLEVATTPSAAPEVAEPEPPEAPEPPAPAMPAAAPLPNLGLGLPHAFSWEASQWPIEWHPYGTGAPARLSEQQVRPLVERVLHAAGVRTAGKTRFDRPGIAAELDGYDAAKRVGWVFVDWQKLEDPIGYRGMVPGAVPRNMLSHAEIQQLMELEKQGREHIIVISYQDDRFSGAYRSHAPFPETALRKLENALRSYLGWLRSQGAL
jgi:hypothetical protein